MKLDNETAYETRDLRRICLRAIKEEGMTPDRYRIRIANARGHELTGYGYYNRKSLCIRLPGNPTDFNIKLLAQVLVHEIGHNQGLRHKDMVWYTEIPVEWATEYEIRARETKPATRRDIQAERYESAKKKLAQHERKLKREERLVKKWRTKVRYYERAIASRSD